jgi:AcrR family transcriptional regulator
MAIIVDKQQKKRDIALAAKELILGYGVNNITVSQIAKSANIGKGTVYEYFKNKDEIVFELVEIMMSEHNLKKEQRLKELPSTREKIKSFFSFFYTDEDAQLREIYKQFTAIALTNTDTKIISFQRECYVLYVKWMEDIIDEAITNQELKAESRELIMGIFAFAQGSFIMSITTDMGEDLKLKIDREIDLLFDLMER